MKLNPGQYFGQPLREQAFAGLTLTLSAYPSGQEQPWHVHANPTCFLLLSGDHRDQMRHSAHYQPTLTLVFHPTDEIHAADIGPQGMLGLNIEYDRDWLGRHDLTEADLGGYRLLDSVWSRLSVLRFLTSAFASGEGTELDTQVLELLEPLVTHPAFSASIQAPSWLRRAEAFLQDRFRSPVSLKTVAQEVAVHPVYLARVFRRYRSCSIGEYVRALRLAEAGRLIVQEGWSLGAAAHEAGFADQAHFTRCCHQDLGFLPRALRAIKASLRT